ncbi:hypothetical protein QQZ08_001328 [Neonectria magnoliae]|uniref:Transmembrane protein n=1 Tax=Neonectria magnoliae TaxID=2732573 RepID=A0ABR1IEI7_9HYPO
MSGAWITLSFVWDFADVQATLNVIVSILGTIGIWTFSRLWYQRNSTRVIDRENTSLSSLFTVTNLGELWDIVWLLKHHLLQVQFIPLLFQGTVVVLVTVITILAGPIARFALRSVEVVGLHPVEGLLAYLPEVGPIGGMVSGNVLWNTTMTRLDAAGFPHDMLLDYLPSNDITWVYRQSEWNSTWSVDCQRTNQTVLDITADQNYTVSDPIRHFPALGATYDSNMFNRTEYRHASDFCGWTSTELDGSVSMKDVYFFVLVQSNPSIHDRMYRNNDAMHLRLVVLHVHNAALVAQDAQFGGRGSWRVNGTIPKASYTSVECRVRQRVSIPEASVYVAWPWTNETDSIVRAYADYNRAGIMRRSDSDELVTPLPPEHILRFYQAYMVSWSVQNALPVQRALSVGLAATQLSTAFLVVAIFIAICIVATLVRYALFCRRHSADIEASQVPDAKLDWMLHAFKNSKHVNAIDLAFPDRDLFKTAAYETVRAPVATVRGLARVYSNRPSDERLTNGNQSTLDVPSVLSETDASESYNNHAMEEQGPARDVISLATSPQDDAARIERDGEAAGRRIDHQPIESNTRV